MSESRNASATIHQIDLKCQALVSDEKWLESKEKWEDCLKLANQIKELNTDKQNPVYKKFEALYYFYQALVSLNKEELPKKSFTYCCLA